MSDSNDDANLPEDEIEAEVEMLSDLLAHEFTALERSVDKVRAQSGKAKDLADLDLLNLLSKLRLARAVDDFTSIYLDLKDEEAEAARELLEELGDDDDDEFEDFEDFEDEDFDDDDDEDDDDFGTFDDDDSDDDSDDDAA